MTNATLNIIESIEATEEKGTKKSINRLREIMTRNDRKDFKSAVKAQSKKFVFTNQRWN